jgi:adenine-specific DNA-methyltransferase
MNFLPAPFDVAALGQVFTPPAVVERMLALLQRRGRVLEPSCGDGAFFARLDERRRVGIELDARHCPAGALNQDFFAYPVSEQFASVIGNPPYVRYQDIPAPTKALLDGEHFDARSNLYLFFIEKCLRHLLPGGELVFITPRDFLKATSAMRLNRLLFEAGTITDFIDLGDARIFADATPNCAIWRFERDNFSRRTRYVNERSGSVEERHFLYAGGHLAFCREAHTLALGELLQVKVGAVSGADAIFTSAEHGNADFVCSETVSSGRTRRMIFDVPHPSLLPHTAQLLARRIRRFDESNWWQWGRKHFASERPRIYVNGKTRQPAPFFLHPSNFYDGAMLALFPRDPKISAAALAELCAALNAVDWEELGFVCDGRFLFTQRALEQAPLPERFRAFLPSCNMGGQS